MDSGDIEEGWRPNLKQIDSEQLVAWRKRALDAEADKRALTKQVMEQQLRLAEFEGYKAHLQGRADAAEDTANACRVDWADVKQHLGAALDDALDRFIESTELAQQERADALAARVAEFEKALGNQARKDGAEDKRAPNFYDVGYADGLLKGAEDMRERAALRVLGVGDGKHDIYSARIPRTVAAERIRSLPLSDEQ